MTPGTSDLTGKLLLAHPTLRDPNFRRSIIYLAKHDVLTGAFGFIINRPISQTFDDLGITGIHPAVAHARLHLGGPVATDSIILASFEWDALLGKMTLYHSAATSLPMEINDPSRTIAVLGYAGWEPGQLEGELEGNSWLVQDPSESNEDLLHSTEATWKRLVSRIHPHLRLLAEMPDDPGLN